MTRTIELPFDGHRKTYDRDKLATAMLVYLDVLGADQHPTPDHTRQVAVRLRPDQGFATDATTYAVGARIAIENNIEP